MTTIVEDVVARENAATGILVVPVNLDAHAVFTRLGIYRERHRSVRVHILSFGNTFVVVTCNVSPAEEFGTSLVCTIVEAELLVVVKVNVNVGVHPLTTIVGLNSNLITAGDGESLVSQILVSLLRTIKRCSLLFAATSGQSDAVEDTFRVGLVSILVEVDGIFLEGSLLYGVGQRELGVVLRTCAYAIVVSLSVKFGVPNHAFIHGEGIGTSRCDRIGQR